LNIVRKHYPETDAKELWYYERRPEVKKELDQYRQRIDELDENRGYVTFPNNEIKLETFSMPSFHHKGSYDDFLFDTGIRWTTITDKKPQDLDTKQLEKTATSKKKKIKEEIMKKIDYMRNQGKSFDQIKEELVLQEKDGIIQDMGFSDKEPIYFNNWYNRWKKKQFA